MAAAVAVALVAAPVGSLLPLVGAPIAALAIGMVVAVVRPAPVALRPGLAFTSRYVLQVAIVLLGATISLGQVASVGIGSVPVLLSSLTAALVGAAVLGKMLGVPRRLRVLLGVGTGICGASAIAAVSGAVDAKEGELRYAISAIFVFNLVAVLVFVPLAHLLGMSQHEFGLWSGTAINDVSSVVAASFAYGHAAGTYGVIVKLTRTTTIIPIAVALAASQRRLGAAESSLVKAIPWFLLWFAAAATANSLGLFSGAARETFSHLGLALTTVALAAVGLSSDLAEARRTGHRPLLLGGMIWVLVAVTSLGMQRLV